MNSEIRRRYREVGTKRILYFRIGRSPRFNRKFIVTSSKMKVSLKWLGKI